ncbi:DUF5134 domain-containing protein [Streptomyces sp. NPDC057682]|uniref:DUF5134 domain-containing protein n=1 Tax=unclassified Streptomyces TaxID=2593676 RepID=UPI00364EBEE0
MHGPGMSGWLLTALCALTGAYCLLRARGTSGEARRGARAEAVMGFGMAAMALPTAVLAPPAWGWSVYAALFGVAALRALWYARRGRHHLHHLVGSSAMVYMSLVMARSGGAGHGAHASHAMAAAGGVPLLTGLLLVYYAGYVLRAGTRLIPVGVAPAPGGAAASGWGARPELALACRLTMALAMFAMLLTL